MPIARENIVQAEFFHVGGKDTTSLQELFSEITEAKKRVQDGLEIVLATGQEMSPGIKTCVRFYDTDSKVTKLVERVERLQNRYNVILYALIHSSPNAFIRWWFQYRLREISKKKGSARVQVQESAVHMLGLKLLMSQPVAVEKNDHSYRPLFDNEVSELLERAQSAKGAWVFIFKPNTLYADTNETVTSMTF